MRHHKNQERILFIEEIQLYKVHKPMPSVLHETDYNVLYEIIYMLIGQ